MDKKNPITVAPRRMQFPFAEMQQQDYFDNNPLKSAFVAALSSTFPPGEAEFIASVRNYRDQVDDPELQQQIRGFIGQEGHHSHQHKQVNEALRDLGYDAVRLESHLDKDIKRFRKHKRFTDRMRLALTVGMEHITAIMAAEILSNNSHFDGMAEPVQKLLLWHAVEEVEHKAVAFDVFMRCDGDQAYLRKIMKMATAMFAIRISLYTLALLWWGRRLPRWRHITGFYRFLWGKTGLLTAIKADYKDYFREGFHPWDHDNRDLVERWQQEHYQPEHDLSPAAA